MALVSPNIFRPRTFVVVFLATVMSYALEHIAQSLIVHGNNSPEVSQSLFNMRGVYERLVTAWPRQLVPRYTAIVKIDTDADKTAVSMYRICDQRAYLAGLLREVARAKPSVIVIDKYFSERFCSSDHPGTVALRKAVDEIGGDIPIVVGVQFLEDPVSFRNGESVYRATSPPLVLSNKPSVRQAVINLDVDNRKLPLVWLTQLESSDRPEYRYTLPLEAALNHEPHLFEMYPRLSELVGQRIHPYTSLMPEHRFRTIASRAVLCTGKGDAEDCKGFSERTDLLRGRIVLIGEYEGTSDVHRTVAGKMRGVALQANYVEALLDERYFRPAATWFNYLLGFAFFLAVELALAQPRWWAALLGVAASVAGMLLLLSLITRNAGYFVNPITFSLLILVLNLIFWARERLIHIGAK